MKKVLCIGNVAYDITILMDNYPTENIKYRIEERTECGGGPASNAAYLLGKWGVETYFAGVVGNDREGRKIKKEFESVNVNTKFLEMTEEFETRESVIVVNKQNGSRTIFAYTNPSIKLKNKDIDLKPDFILVDGQEYEASVNAIKNNPEAISIIDAGRYKEHIIDLCKQVNYIVCSKEFAEEASGIKIDDNNPESLSEVYKKMEEQFKGNIVITLESKGSLYKDGEKIKLMPSIKVKSNDSTGAGDIFHGAFVYGLVNNFPIEKIVKISNIAGALSVEKIGGRYSVRDLDEILTLYEKFK